MLNKPCTCAELHVDFKHTDPGYPKDCTHFGGGGHISLSVLILGCTTLGGGYIKFRNEAEGFQILLNQKGLKCVGRWLVSKNIILIVSSKTSRFANVNLTPFII